jgi:hypothetical protein
MDLHDLGRAAGTSPRSPGSFLVIWQLWGMVGMGAVVRELLGPAHPLARHIGEFLTDLANTNASAHP